MENNSAPCTRILERKYLKNIGAKDCKERQDFLHKEFRFRGKANYRDAIYFIYGWGYSTGTSEMASNLLVALESFLAMSCHYAERRIEIGAWSNSYKDFSENASLSADPEILNVEHVLLKL